MYIFYNIIINNLRFGFSEPFKKLYNYNKLELILLTFRNLIFNLKNNSKNFNS